METKDLLNEMKLEIKRVIATPSVNGLESRLDKCLDEYINRLSALITLNQEGLDEYPEGPSFKD